MNLFQRKDFITKSGLNADFKIECDALTNDDIETLAYLISKRIDFVATLGIPRGGIRLERSLKKYKSNKSDKVLLIDDVLTTGKTMEEYRQWINNKYPYEVIGVVIFARNKCPDWIYPIFQMW